MFLCINEMGLINTLTLLWQRHTQHSFLLILKVRHHPFEVAQSLMNFMHLKTRRMFKFTGRKMLTVAHKLNI